ncbi:MAG TPA: hypothetical protein VN765_11125 [Candidatus Acidoferrum sp.]|nr:hypothetical protein [Candidatus Acidoferrum sp.]
MRVGWQFVLNETSVHFLLGTKPRLRQRLIQALQGIAADPLQKGDFVGKDDTGRTIQIKVAGPFLISFWPDPLVRELRIIKIEWI